MYQRVMNHFQSAILLPFQCFSLMHRTYRTGPILKRILLLSSLILVACTPDTEQRDIRSGYYLPQKISIQFPQSDFNITPDTPQYEPLRLSIENKFADSYFQISGNQIHYVKDQQEISGIITPERLALTTIATFEIVPKSDTTLQLKSLDHEYCPLSGCTIELTLKYTPSSDPHLQTLQAKHLENSSNENAKIDFSKNAQEIAEMITSPYIGIIHAISDHLFLKLTPIQSNGLSYGAPTTTIIPPFTLGNIPIDPANPEIEVLSFYDDAAPSEERNGIDTISYIFIVPTLHAPIFNLEAFDPQNTRLFSLENGYIASDQGGFYAINYHYFPEIGQIVIALTEGITLEPVISHFQALQNITTDPTTLLSEVITLQDITLPLAELETRYGLTLEDMFALTPILNHYQNAIKAHLTSAALFVGEGPNITNGYFELPYNRLDYHFPELQVKIHPQSLDVVINHLSTPSNVINATAIWADPIYIYNSNPNIASGLSYFKELQPGITLEIFSPPYQGHTAEKVLFGKLLSLLDLSELPAISVEMIPNIGRYSVDQEAEIDQPLSPKGQYQFKEGITDRYGKLVKPRAN